VNALVSGSRSGKGSPYRAPLLPLLADDDWMVVGGRKNEKHGTVTYPPLFSAITDLAQIQSPPIPETRIRRVSIWHSTVL
jgi:hypothetical protein